MQTHHERPDPVSTGRQPTRSTRSITLYDCACLSEDIYDNNATSTLASSLGWQRLDGMSWQSGFSAGLYKRDADVVLAYRGTDDMDDVFSDMAMVPDASAATMGNTIAQLLQRYDVRGHGWLPEVVTAICRTSYIRNTIRRRANQMPTEQRKLALMFFDRCRERVNYLTGHSLGGGLAQMVGLERRVPAVGFNSPYIGGLVNDVPLSSVHLLHVNARLDPVSNATRDAGNLAHGRVIEVDEPPLGRGPPRVPPARSIGWWALVAPVIQDVQATREGVEWIAYWKNLGQYLVAAMLHYHGMTTLRQALRGTRIGNTQLDPNFSHFNS